MILPTTYVLQLMSALLPRFGFYQAFRLLAVLLLATVPGSAAPQLLVTDSGGLEIKPGDASNVVAWGFSRRGNLDVPSGIIGARAVVAAGDQSVVLMGNGRVVAWGSYGFSSTVTPGASVPANLADVVAVQASPDGTLALQRNGTVTAWGNGAGALQLPPGLKDVTAIALGTSHAVFLTRDGSLVATGKNNHGQSTLPANLTGVIAIAAGGDNSLALKEDGTVVAWGRDSSVPHGLRGVTAIAAGWLHATALRRDGTVSDWWFNRVPPGLNGVIRVAAGYHRTVALKSDGSIVWWGDFLHNTPARVPGATEIATGISHAVALLRDVRDFGNMNAGVTGQPVVLTLRNTGDEPLVIQSVSLTGGQAADFVLSQTGLVKTLAPGAATEVSVRFRPKAVGERKTTLRIASNHPGGPSYDIRLIGMGQNNTPPVVSRRMIAVEATGPAGAVVDLSSQVTDPGEATPSAVTFEPASGSVFPIGDTVVTARVRDSAGLTATGSFTVRVEDTIAPVFLTQPSDIEVNSFNHLGEVVNYPPLTVQDAVGAVVTYSIPSGSFHPIGHKVVTVQAVDQAGNRTSLTFNVYVRGASLSVSQQGQLRVWDGGVLQAATVPGGANLGTTVTSTLTIGNGADWAPLRINGLSLEGPGADHFRLDTDGMLPVVPRFGSTTFRVSFTPPGLGTQQASIRFVTNSTGKETVVLPLSGVGKENTAPTLLIPNSPVIAEATGPDGAVVNFSVSVSDPGEPVVPSLELSHASGSRFPIGETTVTARAVDPDGLEVTQSFVVSVRDRTPPSIAGIDPITKPLEQPEGTAVSFSPGITDAVGVTSVSFSHPSGSVFPLGSTTVTVTARDAAGNEASRSFAVNVVSPKPSLETLEEGGATGVVIGSSPYRLDLGMIGVVGSREQRFRLRNLGPGLISGLRLELNDELRGAYRMEPAAPGNLAAGEDHEFSVICEPSSPGMIKGRLRIFTASATDAQQVVELKGTAWPVPNLTVESPVGTRLARGAGQAVTWGHDRWSSTMFSGIAASKVAAGRDFSLAVRPTGTIYGLSQYSNVEDGVDVAAGTEYAVVLRASGAVHLHARTSYPQGYVEMPSNLSGVAGIAMGLRHTVAVKEDGTLVLWGSNDEGQLTAPEGLNSVFAVAAAGTHSLALKTDGTVVAWGTNADGATTVPDGLSGVIAIRTGMRSTAALREDGTVVTWGSAAAALPWSIGGVLDSLTYRSPSLRLPSTAPSSLDGVTQQSAGADHELAITRAWPAIDFGTVNANSTTPERSFTLRNTGTAALHNLAATITGPGAAQFRILGSPLPASLAPGESAGVVVQFEPTGTGARTARLRIVSNDLDESPYEVILNGAATLPEIEVTSPASLATGTTVSLGFQVIRTEATRTLTLRNTGNGSLEGVSLEVFGEHASEFRVSELPGSSLAPGQSRSFTVTFAPLAAGPRSATLRIANNDADESPFELGLTGQASALDVSGAGGGWLARPSQAIPLGAVHTGSSLERTFTIRNLSELPVTGLRVVIDGADASSFAVTPAFPEPLPAGESFSFTVRFLASLGEQRSGTVRILSDAGEEMVLAFSVSVQAPELDLRTPGGTPAVGKHVFAWGNNSFGQISVPSGLGEVKAVAAGTFHTVALKANGRVVAWGADGAGQTWVPVGATSGVRAISAGAEHTVALKDDGAIFCWGDDTVAQLSVPSGSHDATAVSAGALHTIALRRNGEVVAWGDNQFGQLNSPGGLNDVVAIAAGGFHALALKSDGSLVTWGTARYGLRRIPASATNPLAISAGLAHSVVVRPDGRVVAWGNNEEGQRNVPGGLTGVRDVAAGLAHTVAIRNDGKLVSWGNNEFRQRSTPVGLHSVTAVAAGGLHTVAIGEWGFGISQLGVAKDVSWRIHNTGTLPLAISEIKIEGADADQFSFVGAVPRSVAVNGSAASLTIRFRPVRYGPVDARLKITSNDPSAASTSLELPATVVRTAAKLGTAGSAFTFSPLTVEKSTGLVTQRLVFANRTKAPLHGLRLVLSSVAQGVTVNSSSAGELPGSVEVIYSRPIPAGGTAAFFLTYVDPKRQTSAGIQPGITAYALTEPEPQPEPVAGTEVPLSSVADSPSGPVLRWATQAGAAYVVEYSDDRGTTWYSAVHRLLGTGNLMTWIDRGQPETWVRPANRSVRNYRVKQL